MHTYTGESVSLADGHANSTEVGLTVEQAVAPAAENDPLGHCKTHILLKYVSNQLDLNKQMSALTLVHEAATVPPPALE
jgi:hypothetical protein